MNSDRHLKYQARATGKVARVGMNYLSDLIIRPGIEKKFRPLLLYRGNMHLGHAHRLWNMVMLMMASEAETLADGLKITNNPDFSQLCGPVRLPGKMTLFGFFGRLEDNPWVTRNIEGLTDYVKSMSLGPCSLTPVDRFSEEHECAPWRKSLHPDAGTYIKRERGIPVKEQLFYPYIAHDAEKLDDGRALVSLVNEAVPRALPEHVRADVCQELIVSILSGEINRGEVRDHVQKHISKIFRTNPTRFDLGGHKLSIDAPLRGYGGASEAPTMHDVVSDNLYQHWSDQMEDDDAPRD